AHIVEHQHHAPRGEPAEIGITLDEADRGAVAGRRYCSAEPGRAAADHDDIGVGDDRDVPRRLCCECGDCLVYRHGATPVSQRTPHGWIARIARKKNTEKAEPHSTVAYSSAESKL